MPERSLRALARKYAKGELDREAYLRSRSEFIEAVLSGSTSLLVNDYPAPRSIARAEVTGESTRKRPRRKRGAETGSEADLEEDDVTSVMVATDPTPRHVPSPAPDSAERAAAPAAGIPRSYVAAAAIAAIVIIGAVVVATRSGGEKAAAPAEQPAAAETAGQPSAPPASAEGPGTIAGGPAVDLIQKFLGDRNWSESARSDFLGQWQALPDDQRAAAMNSGEMAQLNNAIYKKVLEERALSGIGDAQASLAKQRALVEFAAAIGIHDPRLSLPATAVH